MKKKFTLILISLLVFLASAVALTACNIQTESSWDMTADDKEGSVEIITAFFEDTLKQSDMVITIKNESEVQVTENVKGTSSCYVLKDGTKTTSYIKDEYYYFVIESEETNTYFTTDLTKRGYDANAKSYYDMNRFYFMSNVKIVEMLSDNSGTFACASHGEEKDGETSSTLTCDFSSENGSFKITATAKDGLVQTFNIIKNSLIETEPSANITGIIVYSGASVTLPDTDAWDREQEEEEERFKKIQDNENAIETRDAFLSSVVYADNINVNAIDLTSTTLMSETISNGIDFVDYGTYRTYAYLVEIDEDNSEVYFVYDGEEKYYTKSIEDYSENTFVWYSAFITVNDDLTETAEITCNIADNQMTFNVKVNNSVIYAIYATKTDDVINSISISDDTLSWTGINITYNVDELIRPDISGYKVQYRHDPRDNPSAMADIVEDENAIYGFRPSKTGSLAMYADEDWSNAEVVEQGRQDRIAYHKSLESMYDMLNEMTGEGKSTEEIARAISSKRNQIRLDAYKDDPEGLENLKARNLQKYGHEEGPLPDELYAEYGSWETVLLKAFSANFGMDACLGLYDDYYYLYVAVGQIS